VSEAAPRAHGKVPGRRRGADGSRPRRIVVLACAGAEMLDVVGPFQVFASAAQLHRLNDPRAAAIYRVEMVVCSRRSGFTTNCGVRIQAHKSLRELRGPVDTLLIAGGSAVEAGRTAPAALLRIRELAARSRRVGSVCTGALLLARAGLLDGRRATTHWAWCERLARDYPQVRVQSDPIFVKDGNIYSSAGVTAGMDLALALVEEDHGARLALQVARQLVLYLRRPGGQAQFSAVLATQLSDREPLRELQSWVLENLSRPLSVSTLAERVSMSPRNFARVFGREMHVTPGKFIERLRLEAARRRLEETRHGLKRIAADCGLGSVGTLRTVFRRALGVAPGQYRRHFRGPRPS
jgi:transcriptional regulator GlxA family with amidase domain